MFVCLLRTCVLTNFEVPNIVLYIQVIDFSRNVLKKYTKYLCVLYDNTVNTLHSTLHHST